MNSPSLKVSNDDRALILEIADRACTVYFQNTRKRLNKLDVVLDVTACHANGNPLDLNRLLRADDFNLAHDVFGISRHIDRNTGKLGDCFSPRFAIRAARTVAA